MSATTEFTQLKSQTSDRARLVGLIQARGAILVLIIVALIAGAVFPDFLHAGNLADIVTAGSFLGLVAIGQTFVIILGGFDLSVGSMVGLGTVLAAYALPFGWVAALALPIVVGSLVGLIDGLLIARTRMAPFIVTLAALLALKGAAIALAGESMVIAKPGFSAPSPMAIFSASAISSCFWFWLLQSAPWC
jgi:ribose/xylose/arabinose/galactoside ABC-type transport system permease subunit